MLELKDDYIYLINLMYIFIYLWDNYNGCRT